MKVLSMLGKGFDVFFEIFMIFVLLMCIIFALVSVFLAPLMCAGIFMFAIMIYIIKYVSNKSVSDGEEE